MLGSMCWLSLGTVMVISPGSHVLALSGVRGPHFRVRDQEVMAFLQQDSLPMSIHVAAEEQCARSVPVLTNTPVGV